jgi:AraC-like DNA-binding protein
MLNLEPDPRTRMTRDFGYSIVRPAAALARYVDYFWTLNDAPSHAKERVVPSGTTELVVNLHEDQFQIQRLERATFETSRFRGILVSGAYREPFVVETRAHASILGVHFKPGGASTLLGVAADALADTHVDLDALWGGKAAELRDRVCSAADTARRFRILEGFMLARLSRSRPVRDEIAVAVRRLNDPKVEIGKVAKELGLSHRRFIALFSEQIGMTPKRYAMVRRFQRALESAMKPGAPAWAMIALECGYVDQAHLCKDWLDFTGFSPAEFLRLRGVRVKDFHVAVPDQAEVKILQSASARGS